MSNVTTYTLEKAEAICERIASGESLRKICESEDMPNKRTVLRWLAKNPEFQAIYAQAREDQADFYADQIIEIADDRSKDYIVGGPNMDDMVLDTEHVQRSKLRIDSRKWIAAHLKPRKYGDQLKVEGAGPNGEHLVQAVVNVSIGD